MLHTLDAVEKKVKIIKESLGILLRWIELLVFFLLKLLFYACFFFLNCTIMHSFFTSTHTSLLLSYNFYGCIGFFVFFSLFFFEAVA